MGETGVYVTMQIEKLFDLLPTVSSDVRQPHERRQWRQRHHRSTEIMSALTRRESVGEDALPFLYSKMLVQVCVSELEDLRGFLQTRTKQTQQQMTTTTTTTTASIRKVRPLQVLTHDHDHNEQLTLSSSTTTSTPSSSSTNHLHDAVFQRHPAMRRAVEFVVDMVVTTVCEWVVTTTVR